MAVLVASAAQPDNPPGARAREGPEGDIPPFSSLPERMGGYTATVRVPEFGAEPHQPSLGSYRISQRFLKYLNDTKGYVFRLIGSDNNGEVVKNVPYIHRWTRIYQKSILAKFYKLDEWMKDNPGVVSMFTLTTYQGSVSGFNDGSFSEKVKGHRLNIDECFDLLKESRTKLLDAIRNKYPGINYVWILEPHKTGFPHCHLVIFKEFTESEQTAIKTLWSSKYQAGSIDRGITITSKNSDESILSIRNYLMKYMSKQFGTGEPWTKEELLFNAMVWKTGTRMWGASKELTSVMRKPESVSDVVWDIAELLIPGPVGCATFTIWSRDDGEPFPGLDTEQDPDDLAPEGQITKMNWQVMYWAERVWREQCQAQTEWMKGAWGNPS